MKKPLYTIGHGNRKAKDFLSLLKNFEIDYLIDVRSKPYSRFNPQYNQNELKFFLEKNKIRYVFMGDALGGRPNDKSCYENERINYGAVKTKDFFIHGIERLKMAYGKDINAAIMCSESNPCKCHRSKLIGTVLDSDQMILKHIDENGQLKNHATVMNEINKGFAETDIFGNVFY